jgi:hypothetical protein
MEIKKKEYIYIYIYDFYLVRENEGEFKAPHVILVSREIVGEQQSKLY